tara:strand:+ start:1829 stop:2029 length:201 start_codon:yes stop_codon:yes gene_type:complete
MTNKVINLSSTHQKKIMTQREQLMEDIDSIVESYYFDKPLEWQFTADDCVELTRILCDAVCKNFPK